MTKQQALEYVRSHEDDDNMDDADLTQVFSALYYRQPTADDLAEGLWSHCAVA